MAEPLRAAGDRGALTIADRVIEKVAARAATEVPEVVAAGSAFGRAVGRELPRAQAHVAGRRVRVELHIAVAWPAPLPEIGAAVRQVVADRVTGFVGLDVDSVDVTTDRVVHVRPQQLRRVR